MSSLFGETPTDQLVNRARGQYTPNYRQTPLFATHGDGVWLFDRGGDRFLDMTAGIAVNALGHAHPRLARAVAEQAQSLIHASNLYFNEPALALMEELTRVSFGDRVFFTNSGAESNEATLKLARRYWSVVRGRSDRSGILAFEASKVLLLRWGRVESCRVWLQALVAIVSRWHDDGFEFGGDMFNFDCALLKRGPPELAAGLAAEVVALTSEYEDEEIGGFSSSGEDSDEFGTDDSV